MTKWLQSRTINVAALVAACGALLAALPVVQAFIPPQVYGYLLVGLSVVMAYLRVTHKPIP